MPKGVAESKLEVIHRAAFPLTGTPRDYDPLIDRIGESSFVLMGEATHGTHEFYRARAEITRRLIEEKDFAAVAVEADWPDAYRINRFVRGIGKDRTPRDALGDFKRFPMWMWRNTDVLEFVGWLQGFNEMLPQEERVGFYGLDLYSLYTSIDAVISYLDRIDPEAGRRARSRYGCFDHAAEDPSEYGYAVKIGARPSCEDEAVEQMTELRRVAAEYVRRDGMAVEDEQFFAEQNARLIANAERYYREMFGYRVNTWNLRDTHMAETLSSLAEHFVGRGGKHKIVVWEHNSHVGDARATQKSTRDELNVGQLARERYGDNAVLVGFTTHTGTVSAASDWGDPVERKWVRPSLPGSYEAIFHEAQHDAFLLLLNDPEVADRLQGPHLERAIGVIYRPETERFSHYFNSRLPRQFDAVIHFDETRAVSPLDRTSQWETGEVPETYPYGV